MFKRISRIALALVLLVAVAVGGWFGYQQWIAGKQTDEQGHDDRAKAEESDSTVPVKLNSQARKNLGLTPLKLVADTYWRKIEIPGVVVDRPGISDRGVVAPISGVVTQIHAFPGATVVPNAALFTLRLMSDSLHTSQLELFKATREIQIAQRQRQRLADLVQSGAVPQSRVIDLENQIDRMQVTSDAYRQDLQVRGLSKDTIDRVAKGEFVTEMIVRAPSEQVLSAANAVILAAHAEGQPQKLAFSFELQSLNVELGQQVNAGEVLCHLADHRALLIEGRGFREDMPLVQAAARNGWQIEVDIDEPKGSKWPEFSKKLKIDHLSNSVDPETRTFSFFLSLINEWDAYEQDGVTRVNWRFRPGTRVRLRVDVEEINNVFKVPKEAVVREGADAFVFKQNGDMFFRLPVHIKHEDRLHIVLSNEEPLGDGIYIAKSGAATINRVMKAQSSKGLPAGLHVHADGTVHEAH